MDVLIRILFFMTTSIHSQFPVLYVLYCMCCTFTFLPSTAPAPCQHEIASSEHRDAPEPQSLIKSLVRRPRHGGRRPLISSGPPRLKAAARSCPGTFSQLFFLLIPATFVILNLTSS